MPITLVSNVRGQSNIAFTTSAIDTTGATLLLATVSNFAGTSPAISDSKGNTWVALPIQTLPVNRSNTLFYVVNPTVGTGHTFSCPSTFSSMGIAAFSGVATVSPFSSSTGSQGAGAAQATGSISTTSGDLVISSAGSWAAGTLAVTSATIIDQVNYLAGNYPAQALAWLVSTGGSYNFTWSGATGYGTTIAAFRPSSSNRYLLTLGAG